MAIKGASVAYIAVGGILLYSGIKGSTITDTVKAVVSGNLSVSNTEGLTTGADVASSTGNATGGTGSATSVTSGESNYLTIGKYLMSNGYSRVAAAGIVACIAGESTGNPESKGDGGTSFGIIQEHGSQYSNLVTGNASADLDHQLPALIAYNNAQGSGLISMLNQQTNPVEAADFYSEHFERPAVKDSDVVSSVANSVYAELG